MAFFNDYRRRIADMNILKGGFVDDIFIFFDKRAAKEPNLTEGSNDKLATTWGDMKGGE